MQMPLGLMVMYYFLLRERQDVTHRSPVLSLAVTWISISNSLVLQDRKCLDIPEDYPKLVAHVCHIAKVHEDTVISDFNLIILFLKKNSIWVILLVFVLLWQKQQRGIRPRLTVPSRLYCRSLRSLVKVWEKNSLSASGRLMTEPKGNGISRRCAVEKGLFHFFLGRLRMYFSLGPQKLCCVKPGLTYFQGIVVHPLRYLS